MYIFIFLIGMHHKPLNVEHLVAELHQVLEEVDGDQVEEGRAGKELQQVAEITYFPEVELPHTLLLLVRCPTMRMFG